jgi:hypothetical protein
MSPGDQFVVSPDTFHVVAWATKSTEWAIDTERATRVGHGRAGPSGGARVKMC